jgi:hypothetical protein
MKNIIIKITLSALFISFFSCAKKVYFNEQELEKFNVYEKGDVLVFKNVETRQTDTSTIIKKDKYHVFQYLANSDYKNHLADLIYSNKTLANVDGKNQYYMIAMSKTTPNQVVKQSISYLNSDFLFKENIPLQNGKLTLVEKSFARVYKLSYNEKNPFGRKKDGDNPKFLYWDFDYGIIKYVTFDGEVWERINWD